MFLSNSVRAHCLEPDSYGATAVAFKPFQPSWSGFTPADSGNFVTGWWPATRTWAHFTLEGALMALR